MGCILPSSQEEEKDAREKEEKIKACVDNPLPPWREQAVQDVGADMSPLEKGICSPQHILRYRRSYM